MWALLLVLGCQPKTAGPTDGDGDGVTEAGGDCDDASAAVFPGAEERCNTIDDDCDGVVDEEAVDALTRWTDADGDGWGAGAPVVSCAEAGAPRDGDCDDGDAAVNPDALEVCGDGVDADCVDGPDNGGECRDEGVVDLAGASTWVAGGEAFALARGDVDGNGAEDLLVGLPGASTVALLQGERALPGALADALVTLSGLPPEVGMGASVAWSGRATADAEPAVLIGALDCEDGEEPTGCFFVLEGEISGSRDLSTASGLLRGATPGDGTGGRVSAADLDGDGQDEFLVGAPGTHPGGTVRVVREAGGWDYDPGCAHSSVAPGGEEGTALVAADVDGDGAPEVVVGAPGEGLTGIDPGTVHVWRAADLCGGADGATTRLVGRTERARTGTAVVAADLDGDAAAELVIGAPGEAGDAVGAVWIVAGGPSRTAGGSDDLDVAAATLLEGDTPGGRLGEVLGAADLDRDGEVDLVLGAPYAGAGSEGRLGVWYGTGALPSGAPADLTLTAPCDPDEALGLGLLAGPERDGVPLLVAPTTCGGLDGLLFYGTGP